MAEKKKVIVYVSKGGARIVPKDKNVEVKEQGK